MTSSEETTTGRTGNGCVIAGELNIHSAADVHRKLLEALARGEESVDLSQVSACDAIGLQVLVSLRRSAQKLNKPFAVAGISPAVAEAAAALGISAEEMTEGCNRPMP